MVSIVNLIQCHSSPELEWEEKSVQGTKLSTLFSLLLTCYGDIGAAFSVLFFCSFLKHQTNIMLHQPKYSS